MNNKNEIIDKNNPTPIYVQIADWIRNKILNLEWEVNYQLPSEENLSKQFGISRGTLRRALSTLIEEGILTQIQGKGTFVSDKTVSYPFGQELISFAESMDRSGLEYKTNVIEMLQFEPNELLQKRFSIEENQRVLFFKTYSFC